MQHSQPNSERACGASPAQAPVLARLLSCWREDSRFPSPEIDSLAPPWVWDECTLFVMRLRTRPANVVVSCWAHCRQQGCVGVSACRTCTHYYHDRRCDNLRVLGSCWLLHDFYTRMTAPRVAVYVLAAANPSQQGSDRPAAYQRPQILRPSSDPQPRGAVAPPMPLSRIRPKRRSQVVISRHDRHTPLCPSSLARRQVGARPQVRLGLER